MANRSDRNSALPRQTKRMLTLMSTGDVHRDGEVRRLFIGAHDSYKRWHNRMLSGRLGEVEPQEEAPVPQAVK